jgi:tRNA pseudouridine38-40 synthase
MPRVIRLLLAYDGTGFRGWAAQRDPSIRTVEGELSAVLGRIVDERVKLSVAGRTDAGVHARGQVTSFTTTTNLAPGRIRDGVNAILGPELVVRAASDVPEGFDARFSATAREYRYVIATGDVADPFTARYIWHRPGRLHVPSMRRAGGMLLGERDFASFCRDPGRGSSTVRDLQRVAVRRVGDQVSIAFRANAFLHQMVRSLVGALVTVGTGRLEPDAVGRIMAARDRAAAPQIAPPHGLTLERVIYGRRVRETTGGRSPRSFQST